ncbi:diguanylate cyclase domain-containing protein [Seleniivibrio woodruffii]|uniref:diguanylate cyclase domain-containing protein n=1 Tax=Seleniivibrio woodruffii TaxID=1078050 RepID=UPI0039E42FFE
MTTLKSGGKTKSVQLPRPIDGHENPRFLAGVLHGIHDAIIVHDVKGNILSYNNKLLKMLGICDEQMQILANFYHFSADDINFQAGRKYFADAVNGQDQAFTWQIKRPADGVVLDVEVFLTRVLDSRRKMIVASVRDITDKKAIEKELIYSEKRYRQLVEYSPDGIIIHRDGVVKYVNPAAAKIFGGAAEDILGAEVLGFFPEEDRPRIAERLKKLYEEESSMPLSESKIVRKDGRIAHIEFASIPFSLDGRMAVQVVIRDVTQKKIQEEYIRYLALHDTLTGLPNRDLLSDRINQSIERRKRDGQRSALIYIDLDGFKPVNDTLGHAAGDIALKEIADRLNESVRKSDTAARIGGDEFVVLLEGVHDVREIEEVAERILVNINKELTIKGKVFHVGASMGISIYPDDSRDAVKLMAQADRAMYIAKGSGKNRFVFCCE